MPASMWLEIAQVRLTIDAKTVLLQVRFKAEKAAEAQWFDVRTGADTPRRIRDLHDKMMDALDAKRLLLGQLRGAGKATRELECDAIRIVTADGPRI